jgi:hypothetical protein
MTSVSIDKGTIFVKIESGDAPKLVIEQALELFDAVNKKDTKT